MDEMEIAQKLVSNSYISANKEIYHEDSFIFITTNEKINCYEEFLKNSN